MPSLPRDFLQLRRDRDVAVDVCKQLMRLLDPIIDQLPPQHQEFYDEQRSRFAPIVGATRRGR
jgi:hypothetical protein